MELSEENTYHEGDDFQENHVSSKGKSSKHEEESPSTRLLQRKILIRKPIVLIIAVFILILSIGSGFYIYRQQKINALVMKYAVIHAVSPNLKGKQPPVLVALYQDPLCDYCGRLERTLVIPFDILLNKGIIAIDYHVLTVLDSPKNNYYSSRAAGAEYCARDKSIDMFRKVHAILYGPGYQPTRESISFPNNEDIVKQVKKVNPSDKVIKCIMKETYRNIANRITEHSKVKGVPYMEINGRAFTDYSIRDFLDAVIDLTGNQELKTLPEYNFLVPHSVIGTDKGTSLTAPEQTIPSEESSFMPTVPDDHGLR